jgi:DNA helicase HerA-like ATPase
VVGAIEAAGDALPARIRMAGFNRHTFVCGQSGSGKTFSLGVILERLITQTSLRIVVLDPNGDFVRLTELRDDPAVNRTRRVPAAPGESDAFRRRHERVSARIAVHTSDGGLRPTTRLVDLSPAAQAALLRLDPLKDRHEYAEAIALIEKLREAIANGAADGGRNLFDRGSALGEVMGANDVQAELGLRITNLGLANWSVWAGRSTSVVDSIEGGAQVTVADLGALPTDDERSALALGVLEHLWSRREDRVPTLIVIDEAHTVAPAVSVDPVRDMGRDIVVRIAGEGRKFGLFLMVASQRPDKVHPNVLTQCDNLVLMRMNAASDIEQLVSDFSFVPEPMIRQSRFFTQGEAVIAGPISHGPTILRFGGRYTVEGGSDLSTDWASVND